MWSSPGPPREKRAPAITKEVLPDKRPRPCICTIFNWGWAEARTRALTTKNGRDRQAHPHGLDFTMRIGKSQRAHVCEWEGRGVLPCRRITHSRAYGPVCLRAMRGRPGSFYSPRLLSRYEPAQRPAMLHLCRSRWKFIGDVAHCEDAHHTTWHNAPTCANPSSTTSTPDP